MNLETMEEYMEAIYKLADGSQEKKVKTGEIAAKMGISPPSVTEVLPTLEQEALINYEPYYGITLTEKGLEMGMNVVRKHRVLEVFLEEYFSLDKDEMHEKACKMEHIFSKEMIDEMCRRLGAPNKCPHGRDIPSCDKDNCSFH